MRHRVAVVRCPNYREVSYALEEGLELLGGIGRFVRPGERIFFKPNLLGAHTPEQAVTTHPSVVEAVARAFMKAEAEVVIGDSMGPGVPFTPAGLRWTYRRTGMEEVNQRTGAQLNYDTSGEEVALGGRLVRRANLLRAALRADGIVNLPKAKTHTFTLLTASVKNLFGLIPGLEKTGYHAKLKDVGRFSQMLVDLTEFFGPRLTVMDAVMGMEGDGPSGGNPRPLGALIIGKDPTAVDVALCKILGVDPLQVPTVRVAAERGFDPERVELAGDEVRADGFRLPKSWGRGIGFLGVLQRLTEPLLRNAFTAKPVVDSSRCTGCGTCVRACPEGAIFLTSGRARIDDRRCIRCYCCQEVCPEHAVQVRRGWLQGRNR